MTDNIALGWWILVLGVLAAFIYALYQKNFGAVIGWTLAIGGGLFLYGQLEKLQSHGLGIKETILHSSWNVRKKDDGRLILGPFAFDDPSTPWLWTSLKPGRYVIEARGFIDVNTRHRNGTDDAGDKVTPDGGDFIGSFPYPAFRPCSLLMHPRPSTREAVDAVGSYKEIKLESSTGEPIIIGFTINDFQLEDNGGEGWTITITPIP